MLKVKKIQQLDATYVIKLDTGEFFEFEVEFDEEKQEWALVGESKNYGTFNRFSQAELKVVSKIVTELNKRDVPEATKKKAVAKKKVVKKSSK